MSTKTKRDYWEHAGLMIAACSQSTAGEPVFQEKKFVQLLQRTGPGTDDELKTALVQLSLFRDQPRIAASVLKVHPDFARNEAKMKSALRMAAGHESHKVFDAIHAGAPEVFPHSKAFSALQVGGSIDRFLKAGEVDPMERDADGNSLLHVAAATTNVRAFEQVLDLPGSDVNAQNAAGDTVMHALLDGPFRRSTKNLAEIVDISAARGFDFALANDDGETAAHAFAKSQRFASPDSIDRAAQVADTMRRHGSDFSQANRSGQLPLDGEVEKMNPRLVAMLTESGETSSNPSDPALFEACLKAGNGKALLALEAKGSKWREDIGGEQAAFYGVAKMRETGTLMPLEAMIGAGVSFGVRNEHGDSPIQLARDIGCKKEAISALTELKRAEVSRNVLAKAQARMAARLSAAPARGAVSGDAR